MAEAADRRSIKVFLVDDHELVRNGVRSLLESEPDLEVSGEAATAASALALLADADPDVVLLDLNLPDGSGIDVCRELRTMGNEFGVLVLTSSGDDEAVRAALLAGADGFVLKHVRGSDLVETVRAVARGESLLDERTRARTLERLRRGTAGHDPRRLSVQEQRVLGLMVDGLTNRELAAELGLAEKTVKNYVSNILVKLGVSRRAEAAVIGVVEASRAAREPAPHGTPILF